VVSGFNLRVDEFVTLLIARTIGFLFEFIKATSSLEKVEFDDWYGGLYGDRIFLDITSAYIHPRTSIVYGILGLGVLASPVFMFPQRLAISRPVFLAARFIELEVAVLGLRWFIELYAATASRKFNILRMAIDSEAPLIQIQRMDLYFKRFYAPSKLTIFTGRILETVLLATRLGPGTYQAPDLTDELPELTTRVLRPSRACESGNQHSECISEPWNSTEVKIFEASTNYRQSLVRLVAFNANLIIRGPTLC
jgi:hypothetical protein